MSFRALVLAILIAGCQSARSGAAVTAPTPQEHIRGEQLFNQHCAVCHGPKAAGTRHGPTFLDPVYEPGHHGDGAFLLAAQRGVQQHHWSFGPMPPVPAASADDVAQIARYVRWLQQQAGIR